MKKKQHTQTPHKIASIVFGYTALGLLLAGYVASTAIPWIQTLSYPNVLVGNVNALYASFTIQMLVPALAAFIAGFFFIPYASKASRHYNAVMLSIATYWLSLIAAFVTSYVIEPARETFSFSDASLVSAFPSLIVIGIIIAVVISIRRIKKTPDTIMFTLPFQVLLLGGLGILLIFMTSTLFSEQFIGGVLNIVVPAAMIAIAYWVFHWLPVSKIVKLTLAVLSVTFAAAISQYVAQLMTFTEYNPFGALAITLTFWIAFIGVIGHTARKRSR